MARRGTTDQLALQVLRESRGSLELAASVERLEQSDQSVLSEPPEKLEPLVRQAMKEQSERLARQERTARQAQQEMKALQVPRALRVLREMLARREK